VNSIFWQKIPQCKVCSLVYREMQSDICGTCGPVIGEIRLNYLWFVQTDSDATASLNPTGGLSNVAAASTHILGMATTFKEKASDKRIGLPLNASLIAASKAKSIGIERKAAKKLFEDQSSIRIDASLFQRDVNKLTPIQAVRASVTFDSSEKVYNAISALMEDLRISFSHDYPNAERLTRYDPHKHYTC
jgi:hypothetical protein